MNFCVYGWLLSQTQVKPILLVQLIISICNDRCTGHGKTPCPNCVRGQEGPQQGFIIKQIYVGHASLQCHRSSQGVWLRWENKQDHWSILGWGVGKKKKVAICYQLRPEVQTFSHWPLYIVNTDGNLVNHCVCQQFLILVTCLESQNLASVCVL